MSNPKVEWWKSLSNDDRARILIPFTQLAMYEDKPWKASWEHVSEKELRRLIDMVLDQSKVKRSQVL